MKKHPYADIEKLLKYFDRKTVEKYVIGIERTKDAELKIRTLYATAIILAEALGMDVSEWDKPKNRISIEHCDFSTLDNRLSMLRRHAITNRKETE